jgi:hypothetical protein
VAESEFDVRCNPSYPHFYTCCPDGLAGSPPPAGGAMDASAGCPIGPTPPEQGWSCIVAGTAGAASSWCCTQ